MSRHNISHRTVINAPIDRVWSAVIDLQAWKEWNRWTTLEVVGEQDDTKKPSTGAKGKLRASYKGDDKWETFDFTFGTVSNEDRVLTWTGKVGAGLLFSGVHTMRLEQVRAIDELDVMSSSSRTILIHEERFGGLLPRLGLGLPYKQLKRNYLEMNTSLKKYVEDRIVSSAVDAERQ